MLWALYAKEIDFVIEDVTVLESWCDNAAKHYDMLNIAKWFQLRNRRKKN